MYAQVIVDVPAKQTNRPFDYKVPPEMETWIEVGSRVVVPFGPRKLQGFVIKLTEGTSLDAHKVKEVEALLDVNPPLNPELITLSDWLSRTYLCPRIVALQVMIPGALKAKYSHDISVSEELEEKLDFHSLETDHHEIIKFIIAKSKVELAELLTKFPTYSKQIKQWISQGLLQENRTVTDRAAKKQELTIFPPADRGVLQEAMVQLSPRAKRQKEVLEFLVAHPRPISLTALTSMLEVSASTVKSLADKQVFELKQAEVMRDPYAHRQFKLTQPQPLTAEQAAAFSALMQPLHAQQFASFLLHGATGSGKTEVYLQAIDQCIKQGREAIVLVPEISLTPQMVERFKGRFGDQVAVLHSRLSQGERYDEWRKIQLKQVEVVIGARSAIFAPFTRLGLIVIDEEHEASYKQEDSPKYHAREVALVRAQHHQAVLILGSATPSLESYYQAKQKDHPLQLLTMDSRVANRPLPKVEIVDMREQLKRGNRSMFSRPLYQAIADRLQRQQQMVLMLNRRGFSTFIMCRTCGYVATCPHCDISLTYHRQAGHVRCHYCGYAEKENKLCPDCGSEHIRHFGTGTQRVEEELRKLFPAIRVIRMDTDTTRKKGAHEQLLTRFGEGKADVLLGTQMVAKGLDFPMVTLVGVIAADTMLNLPDFRSSEKTFQLLTQVAGRAGRHQLPGEVVIQTYNPKHYSIICASQHAYTSFVSQELKLRRDRAYPPYCQLILITFTHEQVPLLVRVSETFVKQLKLQAHQINAEIPYPDHKVHMDVLGPVASPISKIKDRYRFRCMVKYGGDRRVITAVEQTLIQFDDALKQENIQISVDVNPQILM